MSDCCSNSQNETIQRALHIMEEQEELTTTPRQQQQQQQQQQQYRRRRSSASHFKFMLLALSSLSYFLSADALSLSSSTLSPPFTKFSSTSSLLSFRSNQFSQHCFTQPRRSQQPQQQQQRYGRMAFTTSRMYMSAVADSPAPSSSSSLPPPPPPPPPSNSSSARLSDFQRRMKGLIKRNNSGATATNGSPMGSSTANGSSSPTTAPLRRALGVGDGSSNRKPANLKMVHTLEEYKEVLDENAEKVIVVRFFATWCKACKAIQPSYYRMASHYPSILFLEVPVTNQNVNLHQGLAVPSLPYGHIYYPQAGLVEEMKISKKYFPNLVKNVRWYEEGMCGVEEMPVVVVEGDGDSCDAAGNGDCTSSQE